MPKCTVTICTRHRREELQRCLDAISRLAYPAIEVLVVESAPTDNTIRSIAEQRGARYLAESEPGVSRARNLAGRVCATDLVAFLDDECVPEPNWLSALVEEFSDSEVAAAVSRVLPLNPDSAPAQLFAATGGYDAGSNRRVVDLQSRAWFERVNFGGLGTEAGMAFRRSVFLERPLFDERLGPGRLICGAEGNRAFLELVERGHRVVYTPRAVVRHPYPETTEELRARAIRYRAVSGAYLTLLFLEEPRHRWRTLWYTLEGLAGRRREWRATAVQGGPRALPRWRAAVAWLSGPFLYARARWHGWNQTLPTNQCREPV